MNRDLAASYQYCQRMARRSASSFYYSFLLLPKPKRRAMCALYAFLRLTDDLSDAASPAFDRRAALADWRASLDRSAAGQHDHPLLPALADTVTSYAVPHDYLHAVIDGVEMDLEPREYHTFEDLEQYCYRVASAVGLACLRVWGCRSPEADEPARRLGVAFQLTNILRDLKEDAARGRIYLPREDFERFGYSCDDLREGRRDDRFREMMRFQIARTENLFTAAREVEPCLDQDARGIFGSMVSVYRALLDEIKRLDGDVFTTRVVLSRWRRMRIATRWLLFPAGCERVVTAEVS